MRETCVLGARASERGTRRPVLVDVTLFCDLRAAAATDRLEETVDYSSVAQAVRRAIRESSFHLVEALAGKVCRVCLAFDRVKEVEVTVAKIGALGLRSHAQVCLRRKR
jgi:dihydroneopterin aldolase